MLHVFLYTEEVCIAFATRKNMQLVRHEKTKRNYCILPISAPQTPPPRLADAEHEIDMDPEQRDQRSLVLAAQDTHTHIQTDTHTHMNYMLTMKNCESKRDTRFHHPFYRSLNTHLYIYTRACYYVYYVEIHADYEPLQMKARDTLSSSFLERSKYLHLYIYTCIYIYACFSFSF